MSVVTDVSVPTDSFALQEALAANPEVAVEAEQLAFHSPEWTLPFLWASGDDSEAFLAAIAADRTVESVSIIERVDGEALYKVRWIQEVLDLITEMIDHHAVILEAKASDGRWKLKLRFAEDRYLSSFRNHFAERGLPFEVHSLYHPTAPRQREYGLTPEQYETLVTAIRAGYFNIPRAVSLEELAAELGVSSNAASQRIRRASDNLVRATLTIGLDGIEGA